MELFDNITCSEAPPSIQNAQSIFRSNAIMVGCTTHKVSKEMWVDEFLHVNGPLAAAVAIPFPSTINAPVTGQSAGH